MSRICGLLIFSLIIGTFSGVVLTDNRPTWPEVFDVPFGLSVEGNVSGGNAPIVNCSSHFYYNFNLKAQLITYATACLPGVLPVCIYMFSAA